MPDIVEQLEQFDPISFPSTEASAKDVEVVLDYSNDEVETTESPTSIPASPVVKVDDESYLIPKKVKVRRYRLNK